MVRFATLDDLPRLVELGREFHAATILADVVQYHAETSADVARGMILNPDCAIFVLEIGGQLVGMISGTIQPLYFNRHVQTVQQFFYYVDPAHRGLSSLRLLAALERWGADHGATLFFSGAKNDSREQGMDTMLRRRQYQPLETIYMRKG